MKLTFFTLLVLLLSIGELTSKSSAVRVKLSRYFKFGREQKTSNLHPTTTINTLSSLDISNSESSFSLQTSMSSSDLFSPERQLDLAFELLVGACGEQRAYTLLKSSLSIIHDSRHSFDARAVSTQCLEKIADVVIRIDSIANDLVDLHLPLMEESFNNSILHFETITKSAKNLTTLTIDFNNMMERNVSFTKLTNTIMKISLLKTLKLTGNFENHGANFYQALQEISKSKVTELTLIQSPQVDSNIFPQIILTCASKFIELRKIRLYTVSGTHIVPRVNGNEFDVLKNSQTLVDIPVRDEGLSKILSAIDSPINHIDILSLSFPSSQFPVISHKNIASLAVNFSDTQKTIKNTIAQYIPILSSLEIALNQNYTSLRLLSLVDPKIFRHLSIKVHSSNLSILKGMNFLHSFNYTAILSSKSSKRILELVQSSKELRTLSLDLVQRNPSIQYGMDILEFIRSLILIILENKTLKNLNMRMYLEDTYADDSDGGKRMVFDIQFFVAEMLAEELAPLLEYKEFMFNGYPIEKVVRELKTIPIEYCDKIESLMISW